MFWKSSQVICGSWPPTMVRIGWRLEEASASCCEANRKAGGVNRTCVLYTFSVSLEHHREILETKGFSMFCPRRVCFVSMLGKGPGNALLTSSRSHTGSWEKGNHLFQQILSSFVALRSSRLERNNLEKESCFVQNSTVGPLPVWDELQVHM